MVRTVNSLLLNEDDSLKLVEQSPAGDPGLWVKYVGDSWCACDENDCVPIDEDEDLDVIAADWVASFA